MPTGNTLLSAARCRSFLDSIPQKHAKVAHSEDIVLKRGTIISPEKVERFSRAILFVIALSVILGTLRFFEHDTTIYSLCLGYAKIQKCFCVLSRFISDTEPGPKWARRCMGFKGKLWENKEFFCLVTDGSLVNFLRLGRPFWKVFLLVRIVPTIVS